jgi:hypothetical protein
VIEKVNQQLKKQQQSDVYVRTLVALISLFETMEAYTDKKQYDLNLRNNRLVTKSFRARLASSEKFELTTRQ